MAWFRTEKNRRVGAAVDVVSTDPVGLRRLLAGLKDGSVRRLLILADGPQAPGTPGARALDGVSSALAIRKALLAKIHALGIRSRPSSTNGTRTASSSHTVHRWAARH